MLFQPAQDLTLPQLSGQMSGQENHLPVFNSALWQIGRYGVMGCVDPRTPKPGKFPVKQTLQLTLTWTDEFPASAVLFGPVQIRFGNAHRPAVFFGPGSLGAVAPPVPEYAAVEDHEHLVAGMEI